MAGVVVAPLATGAAGASSTQVTAVGSAALYVMMHDLFPTSLNDLLPGGTTSDQRIASTAAQCAGGVSYGTDDPVPDGSQAGKAALHSEESAASDEQGCIDFVRSSSPPEPGTTTVSTHFDYYAYALTGASVIVGSNSINGATGTDTRANPPAINLGQMRALYGCKTATETWKEAGIGTSSTKINLFLPQPGSDTRTVTKSMLGFTPVTTIGKKPGLDTCTAADVAVQKFPHADHATAPNEENSEEGMLWANSLTHSTPTWKTLKNDLEMVYAAGKYSNEYDTTTNYNATHTNSIGASGNTIGNFVRTNTTGNGGRKLIYAAWQKYKYTAPTTVGTAEPLVVYNSTRLTHPTGTFSINPVTVKEANEWFSHIPAAGSAPTASTAAVPGVVYVYNVADTLLPTSTGAKMTIGFDNQPEGTKSVLCHGDDAATIAASGFLPLNTGSTAPASSDEAGATCREFPGKSYPGYGQPRSWTDATWVEPTGGGPGTAPYTEEAGFPVLNNTSTTLPVTTAAAGDVMLVMAHTAPSRGSSHVTSITDSAGRITWQTAESAGLTSAPSGDVVEVWYGVVKSAGATTIDVHWSGTTFDHFVWADEWRSAVGSSASWSVAAAGEKNSSLCIKGSCAFPSLTAGSTPSLYWGWAYPATTSRAGTTPGVSYYITTEPTHGNVLVTDPTVAAAATLTPTFGQVTGTSWYDAAAVLMTASG